MNKKTAVFLFLILSLALIWGCGLPSSNPAKPADPGAIPTTGSFKIKMTFPASASGKTYAVMITKTLDFSNMSVGSSGPNNEWSGTVNSDTIEFTTPEMQTSTGSYYIVAWVSNSLNLQIDDFQSPFPLPGDYVGVYGGTLRSLPTAANAVISGYGIQTFQINMPMQEANIKGIVKLPTAVFNGTANFLLVSSNNCRLFEELRLRISGTNTVPFGFIALPGVNYTVAAYISGSAHYAGVYGYEFQPNDSLLESSCNNGSIVNVPASGLVINAYPVNPR